MKTSYFGRMNSKNFKGQSLNGVSIARSARYWTGRTYPKLFPTWEMINMTNEKEYERAYRRDVLSKLDALEVYYDLGEDAILLCHEKWDDIENKTTFCHRRMVAKWLVEELAKVGIDVEIPELRDVKDEMKKGLKNGSMQARQLSLFEQDKADLELDDWDWD